MDKEKIKKIFAFLDGVNIKTGKCVVFSESELNAIKSFCFSKKTGSKRAKKVKAVRTKRKNKSVAKKRHKKMSKVELYNMRVKNLAKARKARKKKGR